MSTNSYSDLHVDDLHKLRERQLKNLSHLEQQAAGYGPLNVPLQTLNQLEAVRDEIRALDEELAARARPPVLVASFHEIAAQWDDIRRSARLLSNAEPRISRKSLKVDYARTDLITLAIECVDDLNIDGDAWDQTTHLYASGLTPLAMTTLADICGRKKDLPSLIVATQQEHGAWGDHKIINLAQVRNAARQLRLSGSGHTYPGMVVFDFTSKGFTALQISEIETRLGGQAVEVKPVRDDTVDPKKPLVDEVKRLIDQITPLPATWLDCRFIINPHP